MSDPAMPPRGTMVLYDRMDPPLLAGDYRIDVGTSLTLANAPLQATQRYFSVEGPRFSMSPTEVAGVFPPRNVQGDFTDELAQVVFGRRTLPWERTADPAGALTLPSVPSDRPPRPTGKPPWLALLLFDQTTSPEAVVLADQLVTDVLPGFVTAALNPPADARCQAIEVDSQLLRDVLPTLEELHLLTHVRQVNTNDRELSAEDSDGWFSVLVCARVPQAGRRYLACVVSLEGRTDLIAVNPPPVAGHGFGDHVIDHPVVLDAGHGGGAPSIAAPADARDLFAHRYTPGRFVFESRARLVLLHSWNFECTGTGTFAGLCENLDVGLIGELKKDAEPWPKVADTGHLPMPLRDRAGAEQTVWYRGPLAPFPISRDTKGPYHSADQARRVSPETGMEDVSYAASFEVGRLLAAADARLAQELMRWRRGDYRRSVERSLARRVRERFPQLDEGFRVAEVAAQLMQRVVDPRVPRIDPFELATLSRLPVLDAARIAEAWGISQPAAAAVLTTDLPSLGVATDVPAAPGHFGAVTLDAVAADRDTLGRLADVHARYAGAALDDNGHWVDRGGS